jgi:MATE family multidrug resistance protein
MVISSLSWTILSFIDRIFLFHWSETALAAVFPASLFWWTTISIAIGTCMYVQTFVSQYSGAGHPEKIGPIVWQGNWVALLISPLMLLLIPLAPLVFRAAGHGPEIVADEITYFSWLSWGTPALLLSHSLSSFFSGRGQTWIVMLVDAGAALLNIVLDYWWIFGGLGLAPGGVAGAAIATVVAFYAKLFVYGWLFLRPVNRRNYFTGQWQLHTTQLKRLLRYGGPGGVQFLLEAGGFTAFVFLVGRLGQTELAATNLAFNISSFAFMPVFGFGAAVSILVGQRLGANEVSLASRAVWNSLAITLTYMVLISLGYVLVPDLFLLGLRSETPDAARPEVKQIAVILLRYVALYNVFDALNMIFVSAIKGAGDTRFVMFASLLMGGLLAVVTWVGMQFLGFELHACWTWVTIWVCLLGLIYWARFVQGAWKTKRVIEPDLLPQD